MPSRPPPPNPPPPVDQERVNFSPFFAVAACVMVLCLIVAGGVWQYKWERSPKGRAETFVLQCGDSMSGVDLRELHRIGKIKCRDKFDEFMERFGDGRFVVCKAQSDIGEVGYVCDSTGCSWSIRNGVEP